MLKQTVTYENFDGETVSEDLYFNFTRMELIEFTKRYDDRPLDEYLEEIQEKKDVVALYKVLKDIVVTAYGQKSEDGKRFVKNSQVKEEFLESLAFAQLIEDFHDDSNPEALSKFVSGIVAHIKGIDMSGAKALPAK